MSTPSIFLKSLSAVTSESPKFLAVAAIMASGILIMYFCLMVMAISFIVLSKLITSQLFSKFRTILASRGVIFFFPNNSISDITETPSEHFDIPRIIGCGCAAIIYIKILVSTRKSIPFTAHSSLIFHPVNVPFQTTVKLFKRLFFLLFLPLFYFLKQLDKAFIRTIFQFVNHSSNFLTNVRTFFIIHNS